MKISRSSTPLILVFAILCGLQTGIASGQEPEGLNILVFGAHPDDCEIRCGGVACLWAERGDLVKFVSTTNGDIGHWGMAGGALAKRRSAEVRAAAGVLGVTSEVLDIHDGELMPTLENRKIFTRLIREWEADIVIGHRPNDYHPDHRYTGILMQDSAFMVAVPFFCPDVPPLKKTPSSSTPTTASRNPLPSRSTSLSRSTRSSTRRSKPSY